MKARVLHEAGGLRTCAVVFDKGDEAIAGLTGLARAESIHAAQITAIGAFSEVVLGYFDPEERDYRRTSIVEQVEVLSLVGDIALKEGEPQVHAHVVLGRRDFTTLGGHLFEAKVWPTLEVIVTESPRHLHKTTDPQTGLALIDLSGG